MPDNTFIVGASLYTGELERHVDWLLDGQRDLELIAMNGILGTENGWKNDLKDVPRLLSNYKGRFGIHGPIQPSFAVFDAEIRARIVRCFLDALDACLEVGATHMVIHSPVLSLGVPIPGMNTDIWILDPARAVLDSILPAAERANCTLMMETIYDTRPELLLGLVRHYSSPFLRMSLDTGHAYVMHRWGGGPTPDHWIREAGDLLGHVHLQDTDGYTDRHWPLGEGHLPWFAIFSALGELEQSPRLILELQSKDLPRALQYLHAKGLAR